MKLRNIVVKVLVLGVILGLLWLWWQATAPDLPVDKPMVASVRDPKPLPEIVAPAVPSVDLNDSVPANTTEAPAVAAAPTPVQRYMPDATLIVPLDEAEHYVFKNFVGQKDVDVSILGVHHIPSGRYQGSVEVDIYLWPLPSGRYAGGVMEDTVFLAALSSDDQAYVQKWALQHVATPEAPDPIPPSLTANDPISDFKRISIEEGKDPNATPPRVLSTYDTGSFPPQKAPKVILNQ